MTSKLTDGQGQCVDDRVIVLAVRILNEKDEVKYRTLDMYLEAEN